MNLHNNVFQQKPASNVSMQGSRPVSPYRPALAGTRIALLGSTEDVRSADPL